MAASKRLITMTALTLLKPSRARSLSSLLASSPLLANSSKKLPLVDNNVIVPFNFSGTSLSRHFCSFGDPYFITSVFWSEFTEIEWKRILSLIIEAKYQDVVNWEEWGTDGEGVETEDFVKALLKQKNGLAGRIFSKAGLDNTSILQAIDDFISKEHPKVSRDTSGMDVGVHLNSLLENAIKLKKDMKDDLLSVEHFILAFGLDRRLGQQLFTNFGVSEKGLRDAIDAVRGSLKRELSEHWGIEKELMNRIRSLKEEIDRVNVEIESPDCAATLISFRRQLEEAEKHLADIVSKWTGTHFEDALHQDVVGQNMAVMSVADAIRRSRAGLSHPSRPIASFMFMGPSGLGKRTLVNNLTEYLFKNGYGESTYLYNTFARIDMRGYMGKDAVSRLVVALGHREKDLVLVQLTEFVRHRPYCLILFEQIEKAHKDVLSIVSEILDTGRITDGQGRTVCFKNTVIIMTSKIGSHLIPDTLSSNTYGTTKKQVLDLARETLGPQFVNCIDECILFKPNDASEIRNFAEMKMSQWKNNFEHYNKSELHYTEEAIDLVGRLLYDATSVELVVKKHFMKQLARLVPSSPKPKSDIGYDLVKVDVNSELCLGLVRGKPFPTHYQIYLGTDETGM